MNLAYWRKKRNLTQLQLAILINSSAGYVYELEKGKKAPSFEMLYKLASALDVCPRALLSCNKCYRNK